MMKDGVQVMSNKKLISPINSVFVVCWMFEWCGQVMMVGDKENDTYDCQTKES